MNPHLFPEQETIDRWTDEWMKTPAANGGSTLVNYVAKQAIDWALSILPSPHSSPVVLNGDPEATDGDRWGNVLKFDPFWGWRVCGYWENYGNGIWKRTPSWTRKEPSVRDLALKGLEALDHGTKPEPSQLKALRTLVENSK